MADKHIEFTEEARIEFHKAKCFMEFNGKEIEFWDDIDTQLALILVHPQAFQVRYKKIRIVSLKKFNYAIHYIVKPYGVLVYRFLSQKQDF